MNTKMTLIWAALGTALMVAPAMAQDVVGKQAGSFLVRGRLIDVAPEDNGSSTSIGGTVKTSNTLAPEVDFSYFFTDNIAMELIAATTRHGLTAQGTKLGNVKVGNTWVLPPALTAQYHFNPKGTVSPYLGAGLNYTIFYDSTPSSGLTKLSLSDNLGEVLQAGVDIAINNRTWVNLDVKQIFLSTKAKINGGAITAKTGLDPLVAGIGIGYRF